MYAASCFCVAGIGSNPNHTSKISENVFPFNYHNNLLGVMHSPIFWLLLNCIVTFVTTVFYKQLLQMLHCVLLWVYPVNKWWKLSFIKMTFPHALPTYSTFEYNLTCLLKFIMWGTAKCMPVTWKILTQEIDNTKRTYGKKITYSFKDENYEKVFLIHITLANCDFV